MNPKINQNIKEWWNKLPDDLKGEFPTFVHHLNKNAEILFVGLNPAGDSTGKPAKNYNDLTSDKIQEIAEDEKSKIGLSEDQSDVYWRYYRVIHNIAKKSKSIWEYYDIFHLKYSKSKKILEVFCPNKKLADLHKTHLKNLELIFKELPKLKFVVLNNINSSNLLIKNFGKRLDWDDCLGLYRLSVPTGNIYFYFQGMMNYGRMTNFDQERILWFLKKIKTKGTP